MAPEKSWSAIIKPEEFKNESLVNIADKWGTGVTVRITMPYEYTNDKTEYVFCKNPYTIDK